MGGGDWKFGWGPQDDKESIAAIHAALDAGVNWIDTAAIYGLGHSEEVVRQTLAGMAPGERPYIFTKCGLVWDEHNRTAPPRQVGAPASIRREVEASLLYTANAQLFTIPPAVLAAAKPGFVDPQQSLAAGG